MKNTNPPVEEIYHALFEAWGPQHWWPGRTRLEVMVGAILTQNTAWANVEKAIRNLKRKRALQVRTLHHVEADRLAEWIRPAGYFNLKARRIKAFAAMVMDRFDGQLNRMTKVDTPALRTLLLEVNGIGPETADSILLYALNRPLFVVDAYTRRFLERHGWLGTRTGYDEVAEIFTRNLPQSIRVYNEYHALVVRLGKDFCRPHPRCDACPLRDWLPPGGARVGRQTRRAEPRRKIMG